MSQRRGSISEYDFDNVVADVKGWFHVPTLLVLMAFMLWTRVRAWENFVIDGEVIYAGNDPWYHLRQVTYTVHNWPKTMPFDTWTHFPVGTSSSQFGTLFDQLVAAAALVVGLGDPSNHTIAMVLLFAPAVFGALVAIPVYLGGRRLGGRFGGLVGVVVLALATGGFLRRSVVGFSDHHVAEVFFMMLSVVAMMVAASVAQKEMPVWELVENREWEALRGPIGWSALAGVAMALYLWTWPPAVLLLGIFGVYFIIQLSADFLRGRSPDHIAFAGAISMGVTGLLLFLPFNAFVIRATEFSLLQPLLALGIAFGCVFMAWLAREFEARDLDGRLYPLSIVGIIGAMALLVVLVAPNVWEYLLKNIIRVVGLGTNAQARTVGEAQPLSEPMLQFFFAFGLTFVSAGVAALAILFYHLRRPNPSTESLLIVVWAVFLLLAALTQQRFTYYLVLPIAVLNAFLVRLIVEYITPSGRAEDIETFQILTVVTILIVIVAPMAMATSSGLAGKPAWEQGNSNQPDLGTLGWNSGLHWMHNNTPIPGTYGGADNAMEFEETTQRVGDHDYPPGAYGVMSWWDYGHWITERSERIPNANPFQQGSTTAANFLLAPNETRANEILEEVDEDDAETRYVMIDWKMISTQSRSPVNGKFFAPIVFYDDGNVTSQDMWNRVINPTRRVDYRVKSQRYYESMVNRLWHFHGSSQEPRPVVFDYEERQVRQNGEIRTVHITPTGNQSAYHQFDGLTRGQAMEQARAYVANDSSSQIGGVGPNPPEYVEALEHYRLVGGSETPALSRGYPYAVQLQNTILGLMPNNVSGQNESVAAQRELQNVVFPDSTVPPWVKIFERVPGGTIEGTGPANSTVSASVQIRTPSGSGNFTYSQRAQTDSDGYFEMTVPYSTTGYDEWGTAEGYTDVDAKATGPYRLAAISENETHITRYTGTANVTEGQVIGEADSSTTVAFDEQSLEKAQQEDLADGSNQTDDSSTDDGSTDDGSTDDGSTDDSSTDGSSGNETGGTAERVAPPANVATP